MSTVQGSNFPPARDWWDDLYEPDQPAGPAVGGSRLPDWRKPKPVITEPAEPQVEAEPEPELLPVEQQPEQPEPEPEDARAPWLYPAPDYYPQMHVPAPPTAARAPLSPKTRSALYNASAAGTGWALGLVDVTGRAIASCGAEFSIGGALVLGTGWCLVIAHIWDRRTRHWWTGLAWAARIPLASAVTALALYAPASQL